MSPTHCFSYCRKPSAFQPCVQGQSSVLPPLAAPLPECPPLLCQTEGSLLVSGVKEEGRREGRRGGGEEGRMEEGGEEGRRGGGRRGGEEGRRESCVL